MSESEIESINAIPDLVDRAKAVLDAQNGHRKAISTLSTMRREIIDELRATGLKPADIAKRLGITRARMSQMTSTGPGPERALLAPAVKLNTEITVALVEKRENERQRPALVLSTHDAVRKLERLAISFDLEVTENIVARDGRVDLNQENLVVLIGPRISPVVEQVIASDPKIEWHQDDSGNWYLLDTVTGTEYHSDFDDHDRQTGTCIAHIGRIRRPDGKGSFLYLGGAHAPGTAGAVELLVRDVGSIWDQVHRDLWSAIVVSTVSANGSATVELATPIYVHGKN